jgi:polyisoprenoid-binding protein YceI
VTLDTGSYRLGPQAGWLLLKTGRTGLGRRAGHDLTIEATRWQADVVVNTADPGLSSVMVTIEADSMEVRQGTGGLKPLTDADRADIKLTIGEKILLFAEHPVITFSSSQITGTPEAFIITGDLTIMRQARPVTVRDRHPEPVGDQAVLRVRRGTAARRRHSVRVRRRRSRLRLRRRANLTLRFAVLSNRGKAGATEGGQARR